MRTPGWIVGFVAWWTLCFAGFHWAFGPGPVWAGAVQGAVVGLGMLGLSEAMRRGWIRGWWPGSRGADEARARLAKERESILAEARAKAGLKKIAGSDPARGSMGA